MSSIQDQIKNAVGALSPRRLLSLAAHPALHDFIGRDRIDAIASFINNHLFLKLRQRRAETTARTADEETREYLRTHFCRRPFTTLETTHTGMLFVCCPVYLPTPIGSLEQNHRELWRGPVARKIRQSIIDGDYSYCDHKICPFIASRSLEPRDSDEVRHLISIHEKDDRALPGLSVVLSHDKSCNLACPSCRSGIYAANKARQANLDALTEKSILPMLADAREVVITGSGDAFGSNHFRNMIKKISAANYADLKIHLHTNGQLFDERAWRELNLEDKVATVQISIDAATAETYAFVRRPGNFERLLKNLAFIKTLRDRGQIRELNFSFVVQSRNFREMPAFVRMGQRFSADIVSFNMFRQRDVFSKDEYLDAFIGGAEHPDHQAFLQVLHAPELALPIVNIGNMANFAPPGWLQQRPPSEEIAITS